jgi:hypothetical protein
MRKVFFLLSLLFLSKFSFARVPIKECFDLYHNTKIKHKDLSPAWGMVMLESGHLRGIRFFGDFKSEKNDALEPHPAFNSMRDTLKYNAPQDEISALVQYLFPSPNGQEFALNQRQNDPIGHLSKKENLPKISTLIEAILKYKKDKNVKTLHEEVTKIIESTRGRNDNKTKTIPVFNNFI